MITYQMVFCCLFFSWWECNTHICSHLHSNTDGHLLSTANATRGELWDTPRPDPSVACWQHSSDWAQGQKILRCWCDVHARLRSVRNMSNNWKRRLHMLVFVLLFVLLLLRLLRKRQSEWSGVQQNQSLLHEQLQTHALILIPEGPFTLTGLSQPLDQSAFDQHIALSPSGVALLACWSIACKP